MTQMHAGPNGNQVSAALPVAEHLTNQPPAPAQHYDADDDSDFEVRQRISAPELDSYIKQKALGKMNARGHQFEEGPFFERARIQRCPDGSVLVLYKERRP